MKKGAPFIFQDCPLENEGSRFLIGKNYPVAIDGTQKLVRHGSWWAEEWLERRGKTEDGEWVQQYICIGSQSGL